MVRIENPRITDRFNAAVNFFLESAPGDDRLAFIGGALFGLYLADRHPEGLQILLSELTGGQAPLPSRVRDIMEVLADAVFDPDMVVEVKES